MRNADFQCFIFLLARDPDAGGVNVNGGWYKTRD